MNSNPDRNVLVTGAAGFIGSHVCDALIDRGYRVIALDNLSGGFRENVDSRAEFVEGSINDTELIPALFDQHGFQYVFHLAAYAAEGLSHFIRRFNYSNNLLGSVNLINASVNSGTVRRFVFTSSIAVYGKNQVPMSEDAAPAPEDPYGIAKLAVEMDLRAAHEMFGLDYTIFRPHNVYGERQNIGDPYRNVVGIFINQLMQGQPLSVFGDGKQTRAFSHIDEVAPLIAASIERDSCRNEVYNIGADTPYQVLELAEVVSRAMGIQPEIRFLDARNEVVHAFATHDKVRRHLGDLIRPVALQVGVSRMVDWAQAAGPRPGVRFERIEVERNLPSFWQALI